MIWVKETKDSLNSGYESVQSKNVVLDHGMIFIIKCWCLASISRLLKHTDNDEICDGKCGSRRPRSQTSVDIEQLEGMVRTTCHIGLRPREIHACIS